MPKGFIMMKKQLSVRRGRKRNNKADDLWILRLYVAGHTPGSVTAFSHLKKTCDTHLKGKYRIVIVDLLKHPRLVFEDLIMSQPALVRTLPNAVKKIIGYLSDTERVLIGLNQLPAHAD